ncbi:hypothetical protein [uncultured Corynebacterium sp.]|nr:hypothetical protein [uncultured Corynebacterium sp.]
MLASLVSLAASVIGLGLSSYGAYSLGVDTGYLAVIPQVESFVRSLPF